MTEIKELHLAILFYYVIVGIISNFPAVVAVDVKIYTNDWNPTPTECTNGTFKGLISVFEVHKGILVKCFTKIELYLKYY